MTPAAESALLAAVLESPGDDSARLVYADWLEERGQTERGEFIRIQCQLANGGSDALSCEGSGPEDGVCRWCPLRRRERELLRRYGLGWAPDVLRSLSQYFGWAFRRGFVADVECDLARWVERGPEIVRCQPVEVVRISDREPFVSMSGSLGYASRFAWWIDVGNLPDAVEDRSDIPKELFELLPGRRSNSYRPRIYYDSPEAAHLALSAAAILWAKNAAKTLDSPTTQP